MKKHRSYRLKKTAAALLALMLFASAILLSGCRDELKANDLPSLPSVPGGETDESVLSFIPPQTSSDDGQVTPISSEGGETSETSDLPTEPTDGGDETTSDPVTPTAPPDDQTSSLSPAFTPVSGSFASDTGTSLNISVSYLVESPEEGVFTVRATVYLDSYTLFCSSRTNCNYLTIGENEFVFSTEPFVFNEGSGRHHTELYTAEVSYTAENFPEDLYISASWYFHGSYSKIEIDRIAAETTLHVGIG